jgi:hypothetical protein
MRHVPWWMTIDVFVAWQHVQRGYATCRQSDMQVKRHSGTAKRNVALEWPVSGHPQEFL